MTAGSANYDAITLFFGVNPDTAAAHNNAATFFVACCCWLFLLTLMK
jgi:hypothetical protein